MLIQRNNDVRKRVINYGIARDQAEIIAVPTKKTIATKNDVSLSHVQNVHRVMRETSVLMASA